MKAITLQGFEAKFEGDADPWHTYTDADEALKRDAILHALGSGPFGRVLEIAAGNGSNSIALARRALRLDATEATSSGTALVERALDPYGRRTRALRLAVPERFPRSSYDAIVLAELLYYLSSSDMARTALNVAAALRLGGTLVLAHHRIDFPDFVQHAAQIQRRFLMASGRPWRTRIVRRTTHWIVVSATPLP